MAAHDRDSTRRTARQAMTAWRRAVEGFRHHEKSVREPLVLPLADDAFSFQAWLAGGAGHPTVWVITTATNTGRHWVITTDDVRIGAPQVRRRAVDPVARVLRDEASPSGRPSIAESPKVRLAAYLYDIDRVDIIAIAERFQLGGPHSDADQKRSAHRYVAAGRKSLHTDGAWPWALAAEGRLPRGAWWNDEVYAVELARWRAGDYDGRRLPEPPTDKPRKRPAR